jgi:hexulose-6-phosphate isomerase
LPHGQSALARLRLAAEAGFEGVEVRQIESADACSELREAATRTGVRIHCVLARGLIDYPLTSERPGMLSRAVAICMSTLETAHRLGTGAMSIMAGSTDGETSQAETRLHAVIARELLPAAKDMGIVIAVENIFHGAMPEPDDFARFLDAFDTPWIRANLDIGNIEAGRQVAWIEILGSRIHSLHLKDLRFDRARNRFFPAGIGDGQVNWASVRAALDSIGFRGWATSAETREPRALRALNRVARNRYWSGVARLLPGSVGAMRRAQSRLARRHLRKIAARFEMHLR